ncbi:MAG: LPS export ABC transporter periplasmic protein LptC [Prevotella sp.]|nr:LPS export ABC transporter periplasmic protein LptC [Prevotella sp.]
MLTDKETDGKNPGSALPAGTVGFLLFYLFTFLLFSCSEAQEHMAAAVNPEDSVSMMTSYGVNTLISDSGVIKYRIVTERWDVNTVRQPSRWEFMKGIFFEQFDEQFHVQAYIQADTAWYFDKQRLWHLRGRVSIRNVNGLIYKSEELYWDGMKHEFYSNVFSRVVTPERTLEGTYFRSDEQMNHYLVTNSKGSFVASDIEGDDQPAPAQQNDSMAAPTVRPAATKHAISK